MRPCKSTFVSTAHEKSIDLGLNTSEEFVKSGVRQEIAILINNIVDNAIRYTPINGKIDISLFSESQNLILEVNDSGPGIPPNELERVFERFYRGDNKSISGSGLGLSIVKEIATQHGANIELSNINPGLSFRVYFTQLH